jgi:general secretion pathway protein D
MPIRPSLVLAVSALALSACQHQAAQLTPLPQPSDPNAGVASPRVSGPVGADARSQPEPVISAGLGTAGAAPRLPPGKEIGDVQLNFADTDIREIVRQVLGNILQLNYSIDPAVHGTATIETVKPLKREELLTTLELLLNQNGASLVQNGNLYRVLPSATAVATPALANEHTTGSEVVSLRYASAAQLAKVLEPFVAEGARITPDPSRNLLLVSGEPAARRTLLSLIATFDTDILAGQSFAIFPVTKGDPGRIAAELQKALQTEGESALAGVVRVIPMDRANAVLVVSAQRRYIEAAERLFRLVERARKETERSWHVYYIQNGQANDVANILQRAFTPENVTAKPDSTGSTAPGQGQTSIGGGGSGASAFGSPSSGSGIGTGGTSGIGTPGSSGSPGGSGLGTPSLFGSNQGQSSGSSGLGSTGSSSGGDSASTESLSASTQQSGGQQGNAMRIIPNKQNNALLIFATPEEESTVESMLHKIDIIPLQVRIDATIAEVDLNDALQYGTQFFFKNQGLAGALTQATLTAPVTAGTFDSLPANAAGFVLGNSSSAVRYAIQALQNVSNVRVLASPQLMVLDNQTATLQVGENIPYTTGSISTGVATGTTGLVAANTVSYAQTGVIMGIVPHVNSSGLVTLLISQEVSSVNASASSQVVGAPVFNDRKVQTQVVVQDGQTVGIAGLIQDQSDEQNAGIPFLKDIPILGSAFGTQNNSRSRTELLVMITPHVVQDQRDAMKLTEDLRENLPHAGLVPQQLKDLPISGSSNPNADLTQ